MGHFFLFVLFSCLSFEFDLLCVYFGPAYGKLVMRIFYLFIYFSFSDMSFICVLLNWVLLSFWKPNNI